MPEQSEQNSKVSVLFVCLGNICRSPTAQAAFERAVDKAGLVDRIEVDSAGTAAYHIGKSPDPRSISAGKARGLDFSSQRARKLEATDLQRFDYVLAMDGSNLEDIQSLAASQGVASKAHVSLFLDFADQSDQPEVPDPYYGGSDGFDRVLDLVEAGAKGLLAHINAQHFAR